MEDQEEGKTTGTTDQQNEIIGEEKEAARYEGQEVEEAATPPDPPPTLSQIYTKIIHLNSERVTPDIAMEIALAVQVAPYLPETMKQEIMDKADAYRSASEAYVSVSGEADAEISALDADGSALDAEGSALDADRSAIDADRSALDAEGSALDGDRSAMEEDKQGAEFLTTLEGSKETSTACKEHAALALSAKKEALRVKIEAFMVKRIAKHNASMAKHRAYTAEHRACMSFMQLHGYQSQIREILESFRKLESTLRQCAARPRAEATITMSEGTFAAYQAIHARYGENPNRLGNRSNVKHLYKSRTTLDHEQCMSSDIKESINGTCQLKIVSDFWSSWILNCKISPDKGSQDLEQEDTEQEDTEQEDTEQEDSEQEVPEQEDTKQEIATIVNRMRETLKNQVNPPQEPTELHPVDDLPSQEVTSTQPLFVGLCELIGDCCKLIIPDTNNLPRRIVDGYLDNASRFLFVMMDTSLTLCCELKPLFRKLLSLQDLHYEIFEQTVGHLSRVVHHGWHLWGHGAPTWTLGVTVTLAYITIYRLDLTMVNSELARDVAQLQLAESVKLPLMTLDCFNKWIQKDEARQKCDNATSESAKRHKKEIKELREELYGKNEGVDKNGVPIGIRLLQDLMLKPRSELFGPNYQEMICSPGETKIGELLGTGSFGHVFSLKEEADAVMKVSLSQNSVHLKKELEILRFLGREQGPNTVINEELALPVVMRFIDNLTVELAGGVTRLLTGLVFRPKGRPLRSFVSGVRSVEAAEKFESLLVHASSQLKAALDFLHEKGVCHNDVAPKNIIVRSIDEAGWHVCLVDFGCASSKLKTGFEGTAQYAHKKIFECYWSQIWEHVPEKWEPVPEHDFFSLGLTMSALLNGGAACWDTTSFRASLTDANRVQFCYAMEDRNKQATAKINESSCSKKQKEEWSSWITRTALLDPSLQEGPVALTADSSDVLFQETGTES
jgi:Protein kinase domain